MFLVDARQETRDVDEGDQRDIECVARPDEPRGLDRCIDVERAGQDRRLLRDDADTSTAESREPDDDVLRPGRLDLEERAVVDDATQDVVHVVRLARIVGHDVVEGRRPSDPIGSSVGDDRRHLEVVLRQMRQQVARRVERARLVRRREMRDTASRRVRRRAAEEFRVDILVRHGLHHARSGDEHVARAFDHHGEVGDRRRIDGAAGARTEDDRDLRHDTGCEDVAQEDVGVAAERHDAFLDPRAAGIVETDDRRTDLHREIHDLADLLGVRLRQRATEDREVLAEDEDDPTVDLAVAGDDAVAEDTIRSPTRSRLVTNASSSVNVPGSSNRSSRSRAVSFPASCCFAIAAGTAAGARRDAHLLESRESLRVRRHRRHSSIPCLCARTAPSYPPHGRVQRMPWISTDSVNNSQSVWITGVPGKRSGARTMATLVSPPQTAPAPRRRDLEVMPR